jgi:hypothetical protein
MRRWCSSTWASPTTNHAGNSETFKNWGGIPGPSPKELELSAERTWPQLVAEAVLLTQSGGHLVVQGHHAGKLLLERGIKVKFSPERAGQITAATAVAAALKLQCSEVGAAAASGRELSPTGCADTEAWTGLYVLRGDDGLMGMCSR